MGLLPPGLLDFSTRKLDAVDPRGGLGCPVMDMLGRRPGCVRDEKLGSCC